MIIWIFFIPHSSFENEVNSQVILLEENELILFTFNNGCVNTTVSNGPLLTYIKNDGSWMSQKIPEGIITNDDEYVLTTSVDKSSVFILLPRRNEGYAWDLPINEFHPLSNIKSIQIGKEYIHQIP